MRRGATPAETGRPTRRTPTTAPRPLSRGTPASGVLPCRTPTRRLCTRGTPALGVFTHRTPAHRLCTRGLCTRRTPIRRHPIHRHPIHWTPAHRPPTRRVFTLRSCTAGRVLPGRTFPRRVLPRRTSPGRVLPSRTLPGGVLPRGVLPGRVLMPRTVSRCVGPAGLRWFDLGVAAVAVVRAGAALARAVSAGALAGAAADVVDRHGVAAGALAAARGRGRPPVLRSGRRRTVQLVVDLLLAVPAGDPTRAFRIRVAAAEHVRTAGVPGLVPQLTGVGPGRAGLVAARGVRAGRRGVRRAVAAPVHLLVDLVPALVAGEPAGTLHIRIALTEPIRTSHKTIVRTPRITTIPTELIIHLIPPLMPRNPTRTPRIRVPPAEWMRAAHIAVVRMLRVRGLVPAELVVHLIRAVMAGEAARALGVRVAAAENVPVPLVIGCLVHVGGPITAAEMLGGVVRPAAAGADRPRAPVAVRGHPAVERRCSALVPVAVTTEVAIDLMRPVPAGEAAVGVLRVVLADDGAAGMVHPPRRDLRRRAHAVAAAGVRAGRVEVAAGRDVRLRHVRGREVAAPGPLRVHVRGGLGVGQCTAEHAADPARDAEVDRLVLPVDVERETDRGVADRVGHHVDAELGGGTGHRAQREAAE